MVLALHFCDVRTALVGIQQRVTGIREHVNGVSLDLVGESLGTELGFSLCVDEWWDSVDIGEVGSKEWTSWDRIESLEV